MTFLPFVMTDRYTGCYSLDGELFHKVSTNALEWRIEETTSTEQWISKDRVNVSFDYNIYVRNNTFNTSSADSY